MFSLRAQYYSLFMAKWSMLWEEIGKTMWRLSAWKYEQYTAMPWGVFGFCIYYIYLDILQWFPQKLTVSKPCRENTGRSSFCEVPAEDGAILVVHHFCTAPVLTVWLAEALLSISYLAKSASNINLPIKRGQVPLPEVGKGASKEPPDSRSVGAVLLTGGGMQCTISSQQSET